MVPWEELALVSLPTGERLTLRRRRNEFAVNVNEILLMNSNSHYSEEQLAKLGCAHLQSTPRARILVGGLGMGFTLRAALDALSPEAHVDVAELIPQVVEWNRGPLSHLADHPLSDPRTKVLTEDVQTTIARERDAYDAILLDVDNGPTAFTASSNNALYTDSGLRSIARALRPSGMLALWSAREDGTFTNRLRRNGFHSRKKRVPARPGGNAIHVLWLATRS
ncbi:spermidine synthase [soil metagenome]